MIIKQAILNITLIPSLILANHTLATETAKVTATQETRTFFDDLWDHESDADDPAIWVNPVDSNKSLVIGTLKKGGLAVFNLKGKMIQQIIPEQDKTSGLKGRYNNVDILRGYLLENTAVDLAVVSDRGFDILRIFLINYQGEDKPVLAELTDSEAPRLFNRSIDDVKEKRTAYGLAVNYNHKQQEAIGFVTQAKRSNIAQVSFFTTPKGKISYRVNQVHSLPTTFNTESDPNWTPCQEDDGDLPQLEGLVIDQQQQVLYAGQEQVGIWQMTYQSNTSYQMPTKQSRHKSAPLLIDTVASYGVPYKRIWDAEEEEYQCQWLDTLPKNPHLMADVEGLALYQPKKGQHYLIASSQGDDHFAVYQLKTQPEFIGRFQINSGLIDGVSHTDGIAITTHSINNQYPQGFVAVQDGEDQPLSFNGKGKQRAATNFKFISWEKIKHKLDL